MAKSVEVLNHARFVFFRDSKSLELAKKLGAKSPVLEFGPDGAIACDLRVPEKVKSFLSQHGLEEGNFLCCIPRLCYTPYWTNKERVKFDPVKHERFAENFIRSIPGESQWMKQALPCSQPSINTFLSVNLRFLSFIRVPISLLGVFAAWREICLKISDYPF